MRRLLAFVAVISIGVVAPSLAAGSRITPSFGWISSYTMSNPNTVPGGWGIAGGGAFVEFGLGSTLGLETGLTYTTQRMGIDTGNVSIPLALRIWLGRFFTTSLGGYVDYQISGIQANINRVDYGGRATLGFNIPMGKSASLFTDFYFKYGLADLDTTGSSRTQMQGGLIVGVRFGAGGKK